MPLDSRVRRFLDKLAASGASGALALSVAERRRSLEQLLSFGGPGRPVASVTERTIAGPGGALRLRIYTPAGAPDGQPLPALVYFHGGGFVAGTLDTHDGICRSLTAACNCLLLSVDYRLAPEHPFPAAVEDAVAATGWIAAHAAELGIDVRRLGVCGDSAGATLAAVACQPQASGGQPLRCQVLICPIMDYAGESESRRTLARGYLVDQETLEHDLRYYLPAGVGRADPRVSPLRATELRGLPPACVHTAEYDPLRDEGAAYAARLGEAGVASTYRCHPGMIHLFYGLGAVIPYADSAFDLIGADVRSLLAT